MVGRTELGDAWSQCGRCAAGSPSVPEAHLAPVVAVKRVRRPWCRVLVAVMDEKCIFFKTKCQPNDGAGHADLDAEDPASQSEEEEELASKKKRPPRHVLKYVIVKSWVLATEQIRRMTVGRNST